MATPSPSSISDLTDELEPLDDLERRIERTLELFASLKRERQDLEQSKLTLIEERDQARQERDAALAAQADTGELEAAQALVQKLTEQLKQAEAEVMRLTDQSTRYKSERQQVRQRVEKLLGQMDLLTQGN
jgi:chromosome segregation ATPase